MNAPPSPLDDALLHALVDGRLSDAQADAVRAALARDLAAQAQVDDWRAQRAALRRLHQEVEDEALPPSIAAAAERLQGRLDARQARWRLGGLAASVLLAFGAGWLGHAQLEHQRDARAAPALALSGFAHAAGAAHAVYLPEQRHPVEVPAAQQEHLVQWLSKRLGQPLRVPDLQGAGYQLVGGRLLPGDTGARAQLMFQNAEGVRVTLYVGALQPAATASAAPGPAGETAFRFEQVGPTATFYWVDRGFGYALAGNLPRAQLLDLATQVYRQWMAAS